MRIGVREVVGVGLGVIVGVGGGVVLRLSVVVGVMVWVELCVAIGLEAG